MKTRKVLIGLVILIVFILLSSSSVPASALDDWEDGDEAEYTGGRTFNQEFWVADYTNTTNEGKNLTSSIFYMNSHNVQAFLIAINMIENNGKLGTVPYQLFGLHYYSPEGREVFIGAVFAFLLGYNDTYQPEQGLPNPEKENVTIIVPFGAGDELKNDYLPETKRSCTRLSDTHYVFEISYKNLYAFVPGNRTYLARFTEFTVRYEIKLDLETGKVTAETFYTIGQVTELWGFWGLIPFKIDPKYIPKNIGIAAVHYVATFTSYSKIKGTNTGNEIQTGIEKSMEENLTFEAGNNERVFDIGFRGTYDLLDGNPPKTVKEDQKAINMLVKPRPIEKLLVLGWLGFSADLMSVMSYGISDTIQEKYSSPRDLKQKAIFNFHVNNLWYAVAFPNWGGYRLEHDPTYTAYTSFEKPEVVIEDDEPAVCGNTVLILLATTASITLIGFRKKRR